MQVRSLFDEGVACQQREEWELAANAYSRALIVIRDGDSSLMGLLSNRGLCRARQGQWRNAWLDHDRALAVGHARLPGRDRAGLSGHA